MIRSVFRLAVLGAFSACLAGCGPYTPGAHHAQDASTGSMLSGADTGVNPNDSLANPALRTNTEAGAPAGH